MRANTHLFFIDFVTSRGHNEMDEPSFTQPTMYSHIESRHRVPDLYINELTEQGINVEDIVEGLEEYKNFLTSESKRAETYESKATHLARQWSGIETAPKNVVSHYDTGKMTGLFWGSCVLKIRTYVYFKRC